MASTDSTSNFSTSSATAATLTTTSTTTATITITNATTKRADEPTTNPHELTDGGKAGIAVGAIAFVIFIVVIIVFIAVRRKRHDRRSPNEGEPQDDGKKDHGENEHKRTENKYVLKGQPTVEKPEVLYENPAADQLNYYNVEEENSDRPAKAGGRKKTAVMKQDSVPTIYAPPPPSMEESRASMPDEIAPNCPVIDEDEYIIPEDPSKITVAKRPPYTGHKPQKNDDKLYIDMGSTPDTELYIDPDSSQNPKSYMNFDAKRKPVKDDDRQSMPKDYVNLSKEEKGIAFGVHPKEINATPKRKAPSPVTINDEESYQNVLYENRSMQNKKPQRKK